MQAIKLISSSFWVGSMDCITISFFKNPYPLFEAVSLRENKEFFLVRIFLYLDFC